MQAALVPKPFGTRAQKLTIGRLQPQELMVFLP